MVPDVTIDININTDIFICKVDYYISLVIKIYYNLNGIIGPNVLNIGLIYLLLA